MWQTFIGMHSLPSALCNIWTAPNGHENSKAFSEGVTSVCILGGLLTTLIYSGVNTLNLTSTLLC